MYDICPAFTKGCSAPFRAGYAARSFGENQPKFHHGVSRFWDNFVWPSYLSVTLLLISSLLREGKNSSKHFLICGVQGDFTRSLVENPPKSIWTRQLKVKELSIFSVEIQA